MKKRTVVLAMVLALSAAGCGNSAEPKQEEPPKQEETQKQEEPPKQDEPQKQEETEADYEDDEDVYYKLRTDYSGIIGYEFENEDIYIKVESTEQTFELCEDEWEKAYGQLVADTDIPIYCDSGYAIGYIKTGSTIDITGHGIYQGNSSVYYRFRNPINEAPFDYLYVNYLDCNDELFKVETETSIKESGEWEREQAAAEAPYLEIYEKIGYDKEKEYTLDEYMEIITKIGEEKGKEYNAELPRMSVADGFFKETMVKIADSTEETTKEIIDYFEYGSNGLGGITEFCVVKWQKDGVEYIDLVTKVDYTNWKNNI